MRKWFYILLLLLPMLSCVGQKDDPALDVTVSASGKTEHTVDPGSYTIMVNVKKTTTGTIVISAK